VWRRRDAESHIRHQEVEVKAFAFALSALAITAAINTGTIKNASAAEQVAAVPAGAQDPAFPANPGPRFAEGAPCAPAMRNGMTPHYTWTQGYVQKARWEYHWACVK
jgi:hypothetical protein